MSTDGIEKLKKDLDVLEVMAERMDGYLRGDALFGKTPSTMPELTIGSYLMRQHRLLALQPLLNPDELERLQRAIFQYKQVFENNIVRSEERATREFKARLKQWEEYIRDLRRDTKAHFYYYSTAVAPRVMIAELYTMLSTYPYRLDEKLPERLQLLDGGLRSIWDVGDFVWPSEWQTAYRPQEYWYLYGQPIALR